MRASNAGALGKNGDSQPICLHRMPSTVPPPSVIHTAVPDRGKLVTLVTGKWLRLLFTGDDDEVFMTRSLDVLQRQQNSVYRNCMQW